MTWVLRYYTTRADGKRVEHTTTIGLVKDIGPKKADASRETDRQKLRETINQLQPFQGRPRTYGQLCQHYIENELRIDQSNSARPKEFPTIETYERHLLKRIIPRWGHLAPLAVKSTEVEKWFHELRIGECEEEDETACRSDYRQNPAHHDVSLQARATARVCATTARGQSHELGEPANDQRLHGGPDDA